MPDDSPSLFAEPRSAPRETVIKYVTYAESSEPEDRWWVWPKPKPTNDEARAALSPYQSLLDRMDAAARWEEEERQRIAAVADEAEFDMLRQIADDYRSKKMTQIELAEMFHCYVEVAGRRGRTARWNQIVPFHSADIIGCKFNEPNADGSWSGAYPYKFGHSMPQDGQSVVYWLTDADGSDCYIGSTEKLRGRLKFHRQDGKVFVAWRAVPYPDREAAYVAEDALLKSFKPYLNQKASR